MGLADDLEEEVYNIYREVWEARDGVVVPEAEDLKLSNDAVLLDATVLYADLADSTGLVTSKKNWFAAEVIKAYLHCCAKIIRDDDGAITAYDGDRIMAIWIGDLKNTNAARAALKIHYATKNIVVPKAKEYYKQRVSSDFTIDHGVGIDTGKLFAARTGVRGANDLVWVGPAANWSAKMSSIRHARYRTFISKDVFEKLSKTSKYAGADGDGALMWEEYFWPEANRTIYGSSYWWRP